MDLMSGGLLFREKGSMGDLGGLWGPNMTRDTMPHHALGRLGAPVWEACSIKNRSKIDVFFDIIFDMIFDRLLFDFWKYFGPTLKIFG